MTRMDQIINRARQIIETNSMGETKTFREVETMLQ
jgi:hypothetical protein